MSVRVMAWVWRYSRSRVGARLVLLAIADCANDAGAEAYPSLAKLGEKTGMSERGVRYAIEELERLGELSVSYKKGPRGANRYRVIMRNPEDFAGSDPAKSATSAETRQDLHPEDVAGSADPTRQSVHDTWQNATADPAKVAPEPSKNHQEPSEEPSSSGKRSRASRRDGPPSRPDVERLCAHLADSIEANGSKRPAVTEAWRDAARLLLDRDGRTVEQVVKAIDWCQADEFWRSNILSMPKLRAKYDTLRLQATRNRGSPPNGLVERAGLKLKPETAARLDDRARFEAMDAANRQTAIEGPT